MAAPSAAPAPANAITRTRTEISRRLQVSTGLLGPTAANLLLLRQQPPDLRPPDEGHSHSRKKRERNHQPENSHQRISRGVMLYIARLHNAGFICAFTASIL